MASLCANFQLFEAIARIASAASSRALGPAPSRAIHRPTEVGNSPTEGGNSPTEGGNSPTEGGHSPPVQGASKVVNTAVKNKVGSTNDVLVQHRVEINAMRRELERTFTEKVRRAPRGHQALVEPLHPWITQFSRKIFRHFGTAGRSTPCASSSSSSAHLRREGVTIVSRPRGVSPLRREGGTIVSRLWHSQCDDRVTPEGGVPPAVRRWDDSVTLVGLTALAV
eukprot:1195940-Prorocentrum_minimum.AAC.2